MFYVNDKRTYVIPLHLSDLKWRQWRVKSPANRLFVWEFHISAVLTLGEENLSVAGELSKNEMSILTQFSPSAHLVHI